MGLSRDCASGGLRLRRVSWVRFLWSLTAGVGFIAADQQVSPLRGFPVDEDLSPGTPACAAPVDDENVSGRRQEVWAANEVVSREKFT
jgi:hypothetical protein